MDESSAMPESAPDPPISADMVPSEGDPLADPFKKEAHRRGVLELFENAEVDEAALRGRVLVNAAVESGDEEDTENGPGTDRSGDASDSGKDDVARIADELKDSLMGVIRVVWGESIGNAQTAAAEEGVEGTPFDVQEGVQEGVQEEEADGGEGGEDGGERKAILHVAKAIEATPLGSLTLEFEQTGSLRAMVPYLLRRVSALTQAVSAQSSKDSLWSTLLTNKDKQLLYVLKREEAQVRLLKQKVGNLEEHIARQLETVEEDLGGPMMDLGIIGNKGGQGGHERLFEIQKEQRAILEEFNSNTKKGDSSDVEKRLMISKIEQSKQQIQIANLHKRLSQYMGSNASEQQQSTTQSHERQITTLIQAVHYMQREIRKHGSVMRSKLKDMKSVVLQKKKDSIHLMRQQQKDLEVMLERLGTGGSFETTAFEGFSAFAFGGDDSDDIGEPTLVPPDLAMEISRLDGALAPLFKMTCVKSRERPEGIPSEEKDMMRYIRCVAHDVGEMAAVLRQRVRDAFMAQDTSMLNSWKVDHPETLGDLPLNINELKTTILSQLFPVPKQRHEVEKLFDMYEYRTLHHMAKPKMNLAATPLGTSDNLSLITSGRHDSDLMHRMSAQNAKGKSDAECQHDIDMEDLPAYAQGQDSTMTKREECELKLSNGRLKHASVQESPDIDDMGSQWMEDPEDARHFFHNTYVQVGGGNVKKAAVTTSSVFVQTTEEVISSAVPVGRSRWWDSIGRVEERIVFTPKMQFFIDYQKRQKRADTDLDCVVGKVIKKLELSAEPDSEESDGAGLVSPSVRLKNRLRRKFDGGGGGGGGRSSSGGNNADTPTEADAMERGESEFPANSSAEGGSREQGKNKSNNELLGGTSPLAEEVQTTTTKGKSPAGKKGPGRRRSGNNSHDASGDHARSNNTRGHHVKGKGNSNSKNNNNNKNTTTTSSSSNHEDEVDNDNENENDNEHEDENDISNDPGSEHPGSAGPHPHLDREDTLTTQDLSKMLSESDSNFAKWSHPTKDSSSEDENGVLEKDDRCLEKLKKGGYRDTFKVASQSPKHGNSIHHHASASGPAQNSSLQASKPPVKRSPRGKSVHVPSFAQKNASGAPRPSMMRHNTKKTVRAQSPEVAVGGGKQRTDRMAVLLRLMAENGLIEAVDEADLPPPPRSSTTLSPMQHTKSKGRLHKEKPEKEKRHEKPALTPTTKGKKSEISSKTADQNAGGEAEAEEGEGEPYEDDFGLGLTQAELLQSAASFEAEIGPIPDDIIPTESGLEVEEASMDPKVDTTPPSLTSGISTALLEVHSEMLIQSLATNEPESTEDPPEPENEPEGVSEVNLEAEKGGGDTPIADDEEEEEEEEEQTEKVALEIDVVAPIVSEDPSIIPSISDKDSSSSRSSSAEKLENTTLLSPGTPQRENRIAAAILTRQKSRGSGMSSPRAGASMASPRNDGMSYVKKSSKRYNPSEKVEKKRGRCLDKKWSKAISAQNKAVAEIRQDCPPEAEITSNHDSEDDPYSSSSNSSEPEALIEKGVGSLRNLPTSLLLSLKRADESLFLSDSKESKKATSPSPSRKKPKYKLTQKEAQKMEVLKAARQKREGVSPLSPSMVFKYDKTFLPRLSLLEGVQSNSTKSSKNAFNITNSRLVKAADAQQMLAGTYSGPSSHADPYGDAIRKEQPRQRGQSVIEKRKPIGQLPPREFRNNSLPLAASPKEKEKDKGGGAGAGGKVLPPLTRGDLDGMFPTALPSKALKAKRTANVADEVKATKPKEGDDDTDIMCVPEGRRLATLLGGLE